VALCQQVKLFENILNLNILSLISGAFRHHAGMNQFTAFDLDCILQHRPIVIAIKGSIRIDSRGKYWRFETFAVGV
jgi:hypothetical protein